MLHVVLGGGSRIGRAVRRLTAVVIVLLCAIVLSALVLPTKAEAKRLNVKFVIDNIDDYPDMRDKDFTYICSFYHWEDYAQGGWRISRTTGQWEWQDFDDYFGKDRAVSGPNDKAPGYWYNLRFRHGQSQTLEAGSRSLFYFFPSTGPGFTRTNSGLSLVNIEYTAGTWSAKYNDRGYGPKTLVPFNIGGFTGNGDGSVTLHLRYDRGIPTKQIVPDIKLETSKQIDYLGDKEANGDTTRSGANDYRLYLSGKTLDNTQYNTYKPKNVIFAIDTSLSMRYNFDGTFTDQKHGGTWARFKSLKSSMGKLIDRLGSSDPNNKFSVISFSSDDKYSDGSHGDGTHIRTSPGGVSAASAKATIEGLTASRYGGTDYFSAFRRIDECCADSNKYENVVIFVTDGEPTSVPKDVLRRDMGASSQTVIATAWTQYAAKHRLGNVQSFYSVFIGTNSGTAAVLSMVTRATPIDNVNKASIQASSDSDMQKLADVLAERLKKPDIQVTIEDKLSQYVKYEGTPKVMAQEEGGPAVKLNSGDYNCSVDPTTGYIKLQVTKPAKKNTTYVFSFDVSVSSAAIEKWSKDGKYPDGMAGDPDTDYVVTNNHTSSGQPGYFSNDWAKGRVSYNFEEASKYLDYEFPKPVVQAHFETQGGGIKGHVTLYNQELTDKRFVFQLLDKDGNEIKFYDDKHDLLDTRNDKSGDFSFPPIDYKSEGDYDYTIRQVTPGDIDEKGYSDTEKMIYTPREIKVHVKVTRGDGSYITEVTCDNPPNSGAPSVAHFYNTYGVQGTYQ